MKNYTKTAWIFLCITSGYHSLPIELSPNTQKAKVLVDQDGYIARVLVAAIFNGQEGCRNLSQIFGYSKQLRKEYCDQPPGMSCHCDYKTKFINQDACYISSCYKCAPYIPIDEKAELVFVRAMDRYWITEHFTEHEPGCVPRDWSTIQNELEKCILEIQYSNSGNSFQGVIKAMKESAVLNIAFLQKENCLSMQVLGLAKEVIRFIVSPFMLHPSSKMGLMTLEEFGQNFIEDICAGYACIELTDPEAGPVKVGILKSDLTALSDDLEQWINNPNSLLGLPEQNEQCGDRLLLRPQPLPGFLDSMFQDTDPPGIYSDMNYISWTNPATNTNVHLLLGSDQLDLIAHAMIASFHLSVNSSVCDFTYTFKEQIPPMPNGLSCSILETKTAELLIKEGQDMSTIINVLVKIFVAFVDNSPALPNIIQSMNNLCPLIIQYCKEQIGVQGFVPQFTNMLNILASGFAFRKGITPENRQIAIEAVEWCDARFNRVVHAFLNS